MRWVSDSVLGIGQNSLKKNAAGFSLIEVLLAIVIMAIIAQSSYMVMSGVITADQSIEEHTGRFVELQKAMAVMERDFTQMVPRQARFNGMNNKSAIEIGENMFQSEGFGISFSTGGNLNPGAILPRGEVARVWYRLKEKRLQRATYPFPDTIVGFEPEYEDILSDVTSFKISCYKSGMWTYDWTVKQNIPEGIRLELELADYGKIDKVIYVMSVEAQ